MADKDDEGMRAAMQKAESDFQEIITTAVQEIPAETDRLSALVRSGFALGWTQRAGLHDPMPAKQGDFLGALKLLTEASKELGELLLQFEVPESTISLANRISAFMTVTAKQHENKTREGLEALYGKEAARILMALSTPSDDDALIIGLAASRHFGASFAGFALYRNDATLECKCPLHLAAAVAEREATQEQAERALRDGFSRRSDAVEAFGRYYYEQVHLLLARSPVYAAQTPGEVDTTKALHEAQGFLSRLIGKDGS